MDGTFPDCTMYLARRISGMRKIIRYSILIAGLSTCLFSTAHGQAVSLGDHANYSLGLARYIWKLKEPKLRVRRPIIAFRKGAALSLGGRWQACADLVLYRSTNKIRQQTGMAMESYQLTVPVMLNYRLGKRFFAEAGLYAGALAYPESIAQSELIRLSQIENIAVHMDAGFVGSAGWELGAKKVLKVTYNYGLLPILPNTLSTSEETLSENRYLELSLYVRL